MNPERTKSGTTVNRLMYLGVILSVVIPVTVIIALTAFGYQQITGNQANQAITFLISGGVGAAVIVLGVLLASYFVQRKIKDRLLALVDICRDYAGGSRTVRAEVNGDDEFARLSMSLNTLLDSQGIAPNSGGSEASALQSQIEKLLQEVSAVGDGDLRVQAEVTPDTLGVLADSFNYMIEELAKVVGRVQSTAGQVTTATRRILDGSAELAQASETQVSEILQTGGSVEALTTFIQTVARNAQMSAEASQEALRNANSGQQAVRQTIDGMMLIRENVQETSKKIKRLGERSNEIGEIVRIIEDIADQTNLLALNAAIQSAMAGEHGRGFAVVADEIRLLAERSTESTKRIAFLVKSIQGDTYEAVVAMEDSTQEVVKGSQLADEAGRALNSIYSAVERQAQMIDGIARAANEQATVSEEVAEAMSRISEITRQTNIGTQEAAASVTYLAELSDQLRSSVSTFRLPDRGNEALELGYPAGAAFSNMTSVTELPANGGNGRPFRPPTPGPGAGFERENEWGAMPTFPGNFPPLPEPSNSGALVALTPRSGQYGFGNNQSGFGNQQGFADQQAFAFSNNNQPDFGGSQPGFGNMPSQPSFGGQPGFNFGNMPSQPSFGGQQMPDFGLGDPPAFGQPTNQPEFAGQQSFGGAAFGNSPPFRGPAFPGQQGQQNQQSFGERPPFGNQQGQQQNEFVDLNAFEGQQPGFSGRPFPSTSGFNYQSQQPYPSQNPAIFSQSQNAGSFKQPLQTQQGQEQGQAPQPRPRQPARNQQQQQNRTGLNQDQKSFPSNQESSSR